VRTSHLQQTISFMLGTLMAVREQMSPQQKFNSRRKMPGATCTAHSGATKAHDWMVGVLGPLFRTAGHTVRTQHGVTASAGQRRGDVELRSYLQDAAGRRSLVFDLSMTHDRFWSSSHVQQNGLLSHPQDLDAPLRLAAQRNINSYRQQYADNQNISFVSTSTRMHGEFLRLLFLQAHRETEAHFTAAGMSSQRNQADSFRFKRAAFLSVAEEQSRTRGGQSGGVEDQPQCRGLWLLQAHRETEAHFTAAGMSSQRNQADSFRFKRAAFYQSLKSKVELAAAKAKALRINLNVEGCGIVAAPVHAPSRAPLLLPLLLSHNLPLPRVH
jgi:hypothetical protein